MRDKDKEKMMSVVSRRLGNLLKGTASTLNQNIAQPTLRSLENIGTAAVTVPQAAYANYVSQSDPQRAAQIASKNILGTQTRAQAFDTGNIQGNNPLDTMMQRVASKKGRQALGRQVGDSTRLAASAYGLGAGIPTLAGTAAVGAGINAGIASLSGEDPFYAAGQGIGSAPTFAGINRFTQPGIDRLLNAKMAGAPLQNKMATRIGATGLANIAEDTAFTGLTEGRMPTQSELLFSGAAGGISSAFAGKGDLGGRTGTRKNYNKVFKEKGESILEMFRKSQSKDAGKVQTDLVRPIGDLNGTKVEDLPRQDIGRTGDTIRVEGGKKMTPSGGGIEKESAAGAIAGFEPEYDEDGNITGFKYNPTKGALGVGAMAGVKSLKNIDPNLKSLKKVASEYKDSQDFASDMIFNRSVSGTEKRALESFEGESFADKLRNFYDFTTKKVDRTKLTGKQLDTPTAKLETEDWESLIGRESVEAIKKSGAKIQTSSKLDLPQKLNADQLDPSSAVRVRREVQPKNQLQELNLKSQVVPEAKAFEDIINTSTPNVKDKVGLLDYFRTPDRVLKKIGLEKEALEIRKSYDNYLTQLPKEIDKITEWSKRVGPESNERIFQYLDGKKIQLESDELVVAKEIRQYLSQWADDLGLPKDGRIANYITHIFEKDLIQKEFDADLAKILRGKVAGSVYDPFLEKRLGKLGYKEDTWAALDAYVKRATRKVNMDPVLEKVKSKAEGLEESQFDYVKSYVDRINLRPTKIDNMLDNTIKQVFGYKFGQRPTAALSRQGRQMVYRGTLGLNPGSALKNLSQAANTYAKLGEKYTVKGYWDLIQKGTDELEEVGVLRNNFIEDRVLSSKKQALQKIDEGLFYMFDMAEKINRGSAYWGAKAKAINQLGMNEADAIQYAKDIVRDTQFTFGSVDTPVAMQNDIAKILTQFQSFTLKQSEFLGEMAKNKEYAGLIRYTLGSLLFVTTVGQAIGMEPKDIIPSFRFSAPPLLNAPLQAGMAIANTPDKYGNERDLATKVGDIGETLVPFIPAGVQAKKMIQGLGDVAKGYSETQSGRVRFGVSQDPVNAIRAGLFGRYNLPEANEFYDKERSPLGDTQSIMFKQLDAEQRVKFYNDVMENREQKKTIEAQKEDIKAMSEGKDKRIPAGAQPTLIGNKTVQTFDNEDIARYYASELKQPAIFEGKYYYYDDESDSTRSLDLEWEPPELKTVGNKDIDKKRKSQYKGEFTKRQTELGKMWELGIIGDEEYVEQYMALESVKDNLSTAKSKSVKVPKFDIPESKLRLKTPTALSQPLSSGSIDTRFSSPSKLQFRSTL